MEERKNKSVILFTLEIFEYGGVASFVKQYTRILNRYNYSTVILGREGDLENVRDYFPDSKVVVIPGKLSDNILFNLFGFFKYIYYLNKVFRKYNISLIHLSISLPAFFCLFHPKTWPTKRLITFYGASNLEYASKNYSNEVIKRINMLIRKKAQHHSLKASHRIITFSSYAKDLLLKHFHSIEREKIRVVPGIMQDFEIDIDN